MVEKIQYALSLFDSNEILMLFAGLVVYHAVISCALRCRFASSSVLRLKSLQAERDEYKQKWDHRDEGWKDREDELRRILREERDREISQLKAEYDSYIGKSLFGRRPGKPHLTSATTRARLWESDDR